VWVGEAIVRKAETLLATWLQFLSIIAVPTFPQCKGADSIIWNGGFAVRNDVFDGLAGMQFHATSKKLLCGNRTDTSLLIVTRFLCCLLTNDG